MRPAMVLFHVGNGADFCAKILSGELDFFQQAFIFAVPSMLITIPLCERNRAGFLSTYG